MVLGLRVRSRDVLVCTVSRLRAKHSRDRGWIPVGNFPLLTEFTAAVRPIQPPNRWVPVTVSSREMFQGVQLNEQASLVTR
jgi:hypothetical protein